MAKPVLANVRRRQLIDKLFSDGSLAVGECAEQFGVSTETIRKDIVHLERMGYVQRQFGGAILSDEGRNLTTGSGSSPITEAKTRIAECAMSIIPDKASIFIDGGTTAQALSEKVALRDDLTIFTNSMSAIGPLSRSRSSLFVVGGQFQTAGMSNVGPWAVQAMRATNIELAFLGSDGIYGTSGPTSSNYDEAYFKASVISSARQTVVLADATKLSKAGLFVYSEWSSISKLILDGPTSSLEIGRISQEVEVVMA